MTTMVIHGTMITAGAHHESPRVYLAGSCNTIRSMYIESIAAIKHHTEVNAYSKNRKPHITDNRISMPNVLTNATDDNNSGIPTIAA